MPETVATPLETLPPINMLRRAAGIGLVALCGVAGSYGALYASNPQSSEVIGPARITLQTDVNGSVDVANAPLTDTSFGIGGEADIELTIASEDTAKIAAKLPAVAEQMSKTKTGEGAFDIFTEAYKPELDELAKDIALKTAGVLSVGALGGLGLGLLLARRANLWIPPTIRTKQGLLAGLLVVSSLGISAGEMSLTYVSVDKKEMVGNFERQLKDVISENLSTTTRKKLYDLDAVGDTVRRNLINAFRILDVYPSNDDGSQTIVIGSDEHNNPLAPRDYAAIAQAVQADGIISAGDTVDNATPLEQQLAEEGITGYGVHFEGYQQVTSCEAYDANLACTKPGKRLPFGILQGNHHLENFDDFIRKTGLINLDHATAFLGVPIAALNDACIGTIDCTDGKGKVANREQAEQYLDDLKNSGQELPQSIVVASQDAAEVFAGTIPYIFAGGKHKFSVDEVDGSNIIYLGTIGQGGIRNAPEASALVVKMGKQGDVLACQVARWQAFDDKITPSVGDCFKS